MVEYVLLIAIAVVLSSAVFFYLKLHLPNEKPECNQDIRLTIDYAMCKLNPSHSTIEINITNRGFFKVQGAFIKIGDEGRVYRQDLNDIEKGFISECNRNITLNPDETFCGNYEYNALPNVSQEISVQPVVWIDNKPILCSEAVVSKRLVCT